VGADRHARRDLAVHRHRLAQHDVQVVAVLLDLGPLVRLDDVLEFQPVQVEDLADALHGFGVAEPGDVDPADALAGLGPERLDLRRGGQFALLDLVGVVAERPDPRLERHRVGHDHARRLAGTRLAEEAVDLEASAGAAGRHAVSLTRSRRTLHAFEAWDRPRVRVGPGIVHEA